jgi:hypothetical protein
MAGLVFGGTWAEWKLPHGVGISVYAAFRSSLESVWRETLMLTVAATCASFLCTYFSIRNN